MTPGLRLLASLRSAIETINTGPGSRVFLRILAQIRVSKREFEETTCAKNANFFSEKSSMIVSIFLLVHAFSRIPGRWLLASLRSARHGNLYRLQPVQIKIVEPVQNANSGTFTGVKKFEVAVGIGGCL